MIRALPCALFAALNVGQEAELQAERVATGLQFITSAVWSRDGFLIFADAVKRKVYRLDPGSPPHPAPVTEAGVEGLSYDVQQRLHYSEYQGRRVMRMDRKGKSEVLADSFDGKKFNGPKDIAVRRDGNVFFVDPAFASAVETRELPFYGVFRISPKGEVEAIAKWQTRPNGLALSADGKTLFVSDADRHCIVAIALDSHGAAGAQRDFISGIAGVPAGLCVDVNGRVFVGERGLGIYGADGRREQLILGGEVVTNCAWGENDFQSVYVCARRMVFRVRLAAKGAIQY